MPLQIWCFREMPLQFPNFEKCHFQWHFSESGVAFFKVCKLKWRFSKFAKITVAFFKVWKLQWHFYESPYLLWHLSNLFLRRKQGVNWAVQGTLACLDSLLFYVYHRPAQYFFFLKMASPVFL